MERQEQILRVVSTSNNVVHVNVGWPGTPGTSRKLHEEAARFDRVCAAARAEGAKLGLPTVDVAVSHTYKNRSTLPVLRYVLMY